MTHTPRTAAAVRLQLLTAARAAETDGATVPEEARWAVIREIEHAWRDLPVKTRAANRRAVLRFCFGYDSTKLLSDAYIIALAAWLEDFDAWDEIRLCLRAALVEAGQAELPLGEFGVDSGG